MSDQNSFQKALDGDNDAEQGFFTMPRILAFAAIVLAIAFAWWN